MKMTFDVDEIRVASPCHARWNDMTGDERARFCGQCQKNVYNLSAMTRKQIEALIREREGKFCGRFYRRPDGRMLTADCPSRMRRIRARLAKVGGALCALVLSVIGCSPKQTSQNGGGKSGEILMGDVAVPVSTCTTNPTPATMGLVALPQQLPDTNSPMLMGRIALPTPQPPPHTNAPVLMGEISVVPNSASSQPAK
jgi:hypothetical protein